MCVFVEVPNPNMTMMHDSAYCLSVGWMNTAMLLDNISPRVDWKEVGRCLEKEKKTLRDSGRLCGYSMCC